MGEAVSRKLSHRFELLRIGELQEHYVLTHGPVEWVSFPESHLGDLLRIIQGEINRRHKVGNEEAN